MDIRDFNLEAMTVELEPIGEPIEGHVSVVTSISMATSWIFLTVTSGLVPYT